MTLVQHLQAYRKYANLPLGIAIFLIYAIIHLFGITGGWMTAGYLTLSIVAGYYSGRLAEREYANPLVLAIPLLATPVIWITVLVVSQYHLAHFSWWVPSTIQFGIFALVYVGFLGYFNTVEINRQKPTDSADQHNCA